MSAFCRAAFRNATAKSEVAFQFAAQLYRRMSAFGAKRTSRPAQPMSAFGGKADMTRAHARSRPEPRVFTLPENRSPGPSVVGRNTLDAFRQQINSRRVTDIA